MAHDERPLRDADTELIKPVESSTLEMPAVPGPPPAETEPTQAPVAPDPAPPTAATAPTAPGAPASSGAGAPAPVVPPAGPASPTAPVVAPAAPAATVVPPPEPGTPAAAKTQSLRNPLLLLGAVAAALVVTIVVAFALNGSGGDDDPAGGAEGKPAETVEVDVTSVDPSGGSGFREKGDTWETQTYTSAQFGNLKEGVGLLLDAGSAREVTEIAFTAGPGALQVGVYAGDEKANDADAFERVGESRSAEGKTAIATDGGKHRYWLIWVTELANTGGGYRAEISDVTVRAR